MEFFQSVEEDGMTDLRAHVDGYFNMYDEGNIRGVDVICQIRRLMDENIEEKRRWLNEIISEAQMELTIMDMVNTADTVNKDVCRMTSGDK